jgi:MerR family transcriptional regulator/heat shock protein HspR
MMNERRPEDEPLYVISVAARMVGLHAQSLRHYERLGLVRPRRSPGGQRLYSEADLERVRYIQRLIEDLGVNLAGVEVVIRLNERIRQMEREMEALRRELQAYRDRMLPAVQEVGAGPHASPGQARASAPTKKRNHMLR